MPAPQRFLACYFPGKVQPPSGCEPVMPGPYGRAAVLMGSKPCLAGAYLGRQGDAVMHNVFHFFFQDALYLIALCLGRLNEQLIVEAPEAEAAKAASILQEEMEGCVNYAVPLSTEVHQGKNWLEAH